MDLFSNPMVNLRYGFKQEEVPEPGLSLGAKENLEKLIKAKIEKEQFK